jgi:hypothetical protein
VTYVVGDLVVDALRELASRDYQERVWLGAGGDEVSSLVECAARLFSDSALGYALDRNEAVFSPEADALLRDLRTQLARIEGNRPPAEVVKDSAMDPIRSLANATLRELMETPDV